jgi:uncharacterized membrane protein
MPNVLYGLLFSLLFIFQFIGQANPLHKATIFPLSQSKTQEPMVHAILFWMQGCPNCTEVVDRFLPAIQAQYGSRLDIRMVEVSSSEDVDYLYQIGAAYGLSKEKTGVPLLLIGDRALVGSQEISSGLATLVDRNLQAGGVGFPDLENLPAAPQNSVVENIAKASVSNGLTLAAIILVGMLVSLAAVLWVVVLAFQGRPLSLRPGWFNVAILALAIIGLGVSIYLTVIETTSIPAICGPIGDCNTVQRSPYAHVFGLIPVGVLGALGYLAILVAWLLGKFGSDKAAKNMPLVIFGLGIFGTLFSVYLTYLELFVIKAACIWCLSSAVIMTLILLASLPAASQWLAAAEEEEE